MFFVLGASGGLGRYFIDKGHCGTHFNNKYKNTIFMDFSLEKDSVFRFLDKSYKEYKFDSLISTISYTDVDGSETNIEKSNKITKYSNINISDWCNNNGIPFVFISSNDVFDGEKGYYREGDKTIGINRYAKDKIEVEEYIQKNNNNYLIVRCGILETYSSFKEEPLIMKIRRSLNDGLKLKLFYDSFNSPVYVGSIYDYLIKNKNKYFSNTIRHLYSDRVSKVKLALICAELMGKMYVFDKLIEKISIDEFDFIAKRPRDGSLVSKYNDGEYVGSIYDNIESLLSEL